MIKYVFFYVSQYFWQMTMCNFISRILIDRLVLINLICLVRPILTNNSEISFMDYFLVYHRAKQRAILRNGNMDHFTVIDRTPFEKVHLICCKHLLGTKKTSSNIGVKAELGRFPVENFWKTCRVHEASPPSPCINCKREDVTKHYWHLSQGRNQPLFYTFVKNAYAFKDDDCICRMCEARFRKSLEMSHDTEETSSKRKFRKYDTAIDTSCAFETNDLNFTTANFWQLW